MSTEQQLVAQWRQLPAERQQAVIDFVAFLVQRSAPHTTALAVISNSREQFQQLASKLLPPEFPS